MYIVEGFLSRMHVCVRCAENKPQKQQQTGQQQAGEEEKKHEEKEKFNPKELLEVREGDEKCHCAL